MIAARSTPTPMSDAPQANRRRTPAGRAWLELIGTSGSEPAWANGCSGALAKKSSSS
jgi:hypothetical protein